MQTAKLVTISIVLVLMAGIQAVAQTQTGQAGNDLVSGLYQGVARGVGVGKDISFIMEIHNDGGTLSGQVEVEGAKLPITGSYSRGALTVKFKPGPELTMTAKVTGDQITGTWETEGGNTGAVQMKRVTAGWKQVHDLIEQSRAQMNQFIKAGGRAGDQNSPARKSADQLWDYSRQHAGSAEAKDAEHEALVLMLRAGLITEAAGKTAPLQSPDDTWQRAVMDWLATADADHDYDYPINNADILIQQSRRPELKAQIRLAQGDAFWQKGDPQKARAVFRRVADEYPKTRFAEEARGNIYEIESLNVGQSAPALNSKFVDGHEVRLADYKGKPVLLVFWASW